MTKPVRDPLADAYARFTEAIIDAFVGRTLRREVLRCGCDDGRIESGPTGATYSTVHDKCAGTGRIERLVSKWRPLQAQEVNPQERATLLKAATGQGKGSAEPGHREDPDQGPMG
jgi:hypothetical protein